MKLQALLTSCKDDGQLLKQLQELEREVQVDKRGLQAAVELLERVVSSDLDRQGAALAAAVVRCMAIPDLNISEQEFLLQSHYASALHDLVKGVFNLAEEQSFSDEGLQALCSDLVNATYDFSSISFKGSNGKRLRGRDAGCKLFVPLLLDILTGYKALGDDLMRLITNTLLDFVATTTSNAQFLAATGGGEPSVRLLSTFLPACGDLACGIDVMEVVYWCAKAKALTPEHTQHFKPDFLRLLDKVVKQSNKELNLSQEMHALLLCYTKGQGTATSLYSLAAKRIEVGNATDLAAEGYYVDFGLHGISLSLMLPDDDRKMPDDASVDIVDFPYSGMQRVQALNLKNNLVLLEITLKGVPDVLANVSEDFVRHRKLSLTFNRREIEGLPAAAPLVAASMTRYNISVQTADGEEAVDVTQNTAKRKVSWGMAVYSKLPLSKSTAGGADSINAQSTAGKAGVAAAAQQQQQLQPKPAIKPSPVQKQNEFEEQGDASQAGPLTQAPPTSQPMAPEEEPAADEHLSLGQQQQQEREEEEQETRLALKAPNGSLLASEGWRTRKPAATGKGQGSNRGTAMGAFEDEGRSDDEEPEVMSPPLKVPPKEEEEEEQVAAAAAAEQAAWELQQLELEPEGAQQDEAQQQEERVAKVKTKQRGRPPKQLGSDKKKPDPKKAQPAKKGAAKPKGPAAGTKRKGMAAMMATAPSQDDPIEMTREEELELEQQQQPGAKRQRGGSQQVDRSQKASQKASHQVKAQPSQAKQQPARANPHHTQSEWSDDEEGVAAAAAAAMAAAEAEPAPAQAAKGAAGQGKQPAKGRKGSQAAAASQKGPSERKGPSPPKAPAAEEQQGEPSLAGALAGPSKPQGADAAKSTAAAAVSKKPARKAATGSLAEGDPFAFAAGEAEEDGKPTPAGMGGKGTKPLAKKAGAAKKAAGQAPRPSPLRRLMGKAAPAAKAKQQQQQEEEEEEEVEEQAVKENLEPEPASKPAAATKRAGKAAAKPAAAKPAAAKAKAKAKAGGAAKAGAGKKAAGKAAGKAAAAAAKKLQAQEDQFDSEDEQEEEELLQGAHGKDRTVRGKSLDLSGDLEQIMPEEDLVEPTAAKEAIPAQWTAQDDLELIRAMDAFQLQEEEEGSSESDDELLEGREEEEGAGVGEGWLDGALAVGGFEWDGEPAECQNVNQQSHWEEPNLVCNPESIKAITKRFEFAPPTEAAARAAAAEGGNRRGAAAKGVPAALKALSQGASGAGASGASKKGGGAANKKGGSSAGKNGKSKAPLLSPLLALNSTKPLTTRLNSSAIEQADKLDSAFPTGGTQKGRSGSGKGRGATAAAGRKQLGTVTAAAAAAAAAANEEEEEAGSKRQKRGKGASAVKVSSIKVPGGRSAGKKQVAFADELDESQALSIHGLLAKITQGTQGDSQYDSDGEGDMAQLAQLLAAVTKKKKQHAQKKCQDELKALQQEMCAKVAAVEARAQQAQQQLAERATREFNELNSQLEAVVGVIKQLTEAYHARVSENWEEYRELFTKQDQISEAMAHAREELQAATQQELSALQKEIGRRLQEAQARTEKMARSAAKLPGLANLLQQYV